MRPTKSNLGLAAVLARIFVPALLSWITLLLNIHLVVGQECISDSVKVGYRDFNFVGGDVTSQPTAEKPESKLWWNDGFWWGVLWNNTSRTFRIHRFDFTNQCWIDVGPDVDERPRSSADVLWDGQKLYIASRAKSTHKPEHGSESARLNRYSYDSISKNYSLEDGFPADVNNAKSRALVLTKDSTGKLWVTWVEEDDVMVNRTLGDDLTWGTPFVLPVQGNDVDILDISSIVAFAGDKVGIFWGNQIDKKYYFAVHRDTNDDTVWEPREEALADEILGPVADDHINIACSINNGTLIVAVKTGVNGANIPRIYVLKRDAISGLWSRHVFGLGQDDHTRPIALINSETDSLYVFARVKKRAAIYMKRAHLDNLTFPGGEGTLYIQSEPDSNVNNPTSTKQCVNSMTGLLVLASDQTTKFYLHNFMDLKEMPVKVDEQLVIEKSPRFELQQNYPNPFNPITTIRYSIPKSISVTLKIFNLLGEELITLVNDKKIAGAYSLEWDARQFASGIYVYRLQAGNLIKTKKLILLK